MTDAERAFQQLMAIHDHHVLRAFAIPPPDVTAAAKARLGDPPEWVSTERHDWLTAYTAQWRDGFQHTIIRANERPPPKPRKPEAQRRAWGIFVRIR